MATTNVGKPFGIVTSKNQATAITESKQDANSGQFYITRTNNSNTGGVGNTQGDASEAISLTINGNVLRGISKADATKLASLSTNTGDGISNLMVGAGLTKTGNIINLNLGTGVSTGGDSKLIVKTGNWLTTDSNNSITLNTKILEGQTINPGDNKSYSKGGIDFPTIKSGAEENAYLQLRCGTGLAFSEGGLKISGLTSSVQDGRYYVNIDNTTIGLNTNSKLRVKHDSTLSESSNGLSVKVGNNLVTGDDGINIQLPVPIPSDLQQLPVSTAAILVNDGNNGLCVDIPALKRLVELIMAAK